MAGLFAGLWFPLRSRLLRPQDDPSISPSSPPLRGLLGSRSAAWNTSSATSKILSPFQ